MTRRTPSVLVVDDDFDIVEILAEVLTTLGHQVATAHTGAEGLAALRKSALPDLVLLDVEMPVMSGAEMAHKMRLHDAGEELVPIILLSARPDLAAIAAAIGTPYFLKKPFDLETLLVLIERVLREPIGSAPRCGADSSSAAH